MTTLLHTILRNAAETECTEAQVNRFVEGLIRDDKISLVMSDNDIYLDLVGKSWVNEFKFWLRDQLTVEYQLKDDSCVKTFKIVSERLEEAQLVWDSLVYLRNHYRVVSGRPF